MRKTMSALPPKADIAGVECDVRYVPIADINDMIFCIARQM